MVLEESPIIDKLLNFLGSTSFYEVKGVMEDANDARSPFDILYDGKNGCKSCPPLCCSAQRAYLCGLDLSI